MQKAYLPYREKYEPYTNWGSRIKYIYKEFRDDDGNIEEVISCYFPIDFWNEYLKIRETTIDVNESKSLDTFKHKGSW